MYEAKNRQCNMSLHFMRLLSNVGINNKTSLILLYLFVKTRIHINCYIVSRRDVVINKKCPVIKRNTVQ